MIGVDNLLKFEDVIYGNYSEYPEEVQQYMKKYSELLREKIKAELIKSKTEKILNDINKDNETFVSVLSEILENGTKGYNNMSTKMLIDMLLEIKSPEEFAAILEAVNDEIADSDK